MPLWLKVSLTKVGGWWLFYRYIKKKQICCYLHVAMEINFNNVIHILLFSFKKFAIICGILHLVSRFFICKIYPIIIGIKHCCRVWHYGTYKKCLNNQYSILRFRIKYSDTKIQNKDITILKFNSSLEIIHMKIK